MPDASLYSDLAKDQQVELFPTFGYLDEQEASWRLPLAGIASRPGVDSVRQRMFLRLLGRLLKQDTDLLSSHKVFQSRIQGFIAQPQRCRQISVRVSPDAVHRCGRSARSGHFAGLAAVPHARLSPCTLEHGDRPASHQVSIELPPDDTRNFASQVQLVPPSGISVISDIDDTIKVTAVGDRDQVLHNTFLNPFVAVPGMSQLYREWSEAGCAFHFVSSSPWQLLGPLKQLFANEAFPQASLHLRSIRFRDPTVFKLLISPKRYKYRVIMSILRAFPGRQFILVGDSGEKDAEIYGAVARKRPEQVERILIRLAGGGRAWTSKRTRKAFRGLRPALWTDFREPDEVRAMGILPAASSV